jgi:nucleotidyltransferase substrate binding protein (TIGR01987 family)
MSEPHLELSALRNAVASLEGGLGLVTNNAWFNEQLPIVQNTLIAGVIQNFEFVYELSIKMIRRQIELDADNPAELDQTNFRDLLRIAAEKGLIADVEAWFFYGSMRNASAHTYDQQKARQIYQDTLKFVDDARSLLACLESRNG